MASVAARHSALVLLFAALAAAPECGVFNAPPWPASSRLLDHEATEFMRSAPLADLSSYVNQRDRLGRTLPDRTLVGARVARGLSQQELAGRLGTDPSQVSRDERNEYRGVTAGRAQRILEALGVWFTAEAESLFVPDDEAEYA